MSAFLFCRKVTVPRLGCLAEDVLKARLKTMGVVEHTFSIPESQHSIDWKVYDVGGARNQRHAWAPYFEDGKLDVIATSSSYLISRQ